MFALVLRYFNLYTSYYEALDLSLPMASIRQDRHLDAKVLFGLLGLLHGLPLRLPAIGTEIVLSIVVGVNEMRQNAVVATNTAELSLFLLEIPIYKWGR